MSRPAIGVLLVLVFILSEAVQTVYLGGLFQRMSAFTFGALVFGATVIVSVGWTAATNPASLRAAFANPGALLGINLCALMTFGCFLLSVQLIEPVITYTISAGTMPVATYCLSKLGVREADGLRNRFEVAGIALLLIALVFLAMATINGQTGFVRGDRTFAIAGVLLAVTDGVFFTLILVFSKRLDLAGVGAFAVLGLRLPLYVIMAGTLATLGVDSKVPMPMAETAFFVFIGFLLTTPPLYVLQKAVSMVSTLTVSSLTALGPFAIFVLQMVEGRVAYSGQTLVGICIYATASVLAALGAVAASTRNNRSPT